MFNVYLPKLLEGRSSSASFDESSSSLESNLWDVVIYALGGCPGAIVRIIRFLRHLVSLTAVTSDAVGRLPDRITSRPAMVLGRQHLRHRVVLPLLRLC